MTAEAKRDTAEDAAMLDAVALGSRCADADCAEHAAASDAGAAGASAASPADEEEAARALAEHNALALAFDDVRAESREGRAAASDAGAAGASAASPADEEEAARALAEHNALALAFDDVRAESREGRLVSPARWTELGLVPEHLTDEDFEMRARVRRRARRVARGAFGFARQVDGAGVGARAFDGRGLRDARLRVLGG